MCQIWVSVLSLTYCFCWFPHLGHDSFVHIFAPPSLWLYSRTLVHWLVVDFCICFHLFQEEGSSFSGCVDCRLVIFCFMSKIHIWVSTCHVCLFVTGLPHSGWFLLVPSICLPISRFHCFFLLSSIPLCKCNTFLYPFFSWGASRLLPVSGYYT